MNLHERTLSVLACRVSAGLEPAREGNMPWHLPSKGFPEPGWGCLPIPLGKVGGGGSGPLGGVFLPH